jgi:hypothetical protein
MPENKSRLPAELAGRVQIGTIPAFSSQRAKLQDGADSAHLYGLYVGLRWAYDEISAVIFPDLKTALLWPGFELAAGQDVAPS